MKNKLISSAFIVTLIAVLISACASNNLPKVKDATYDAYNRGDEKGFITKFSLKQPAPQPTAVIINHIEQPITAQPDGYGHFTVNVIAQSRKIFGFRPRKSDRENGIIFRTDSAEIFKPVNFRRISH